MDLTAYSWKWALRSDGGGYFTRWTLWTKAKKTLDNGQRIQYILYCQNELTKPMPTLDPVTEKFILHWGEMGTRWGVNRTVAQIHALLYLSPQPMNAEEIAGTLSIARSNVSTSLRELESWGIVRAVHLLGDRREHYQAPKDVWEMARIILDERKRREIDPTVSVLRECLHELEGKSAAQIEMRQRLEAMLEFVEMLTSFYMQMSRLPTGTIRGLLSAQGKVRRLLAGRRSAPAAGE